MNESETLESNEEILRSINENEVISDGPTARHGDIESRALHNHCVMYRPSYVGLTCMRQKSTLQHEQTATCNGNSSNM